MVDTRQSLVVRGARPPTLCLRSPLGPVPRPDARATASATSARRRRLDMTGGHHLPRHWTLVCLLAVILGPDVIR